MIDCCDCSYLEDTIMGDMIFFGSAAGAAPCLKEAYDHSCVMDEALGLIAHTLRQIEAGEDIRN